MFTRAILRTPGPDFARGLTTATGPAPGYALLLRQHAAYARALAGLGLDLEVLDPLPGFPDAYFVEDAALVFPELAVQTRPGAPARRGEAQALAPVLARHRRVVALEAPATLDGGDVLQVERQVFVGLSERTNSAGAEQLLAVLAPSGYRVVPVPVAAGLHFKSSVTWVGERTLLATEAFRDRPELAGYRILTAPPGEEYACNTLLVNGTLMVPAGYPGTRERLEALGLPILELDTSEARRMDGGLTCMSLRF